MLSILLGCWNPLVQCVIHNRDKEVLGPYLGQKRTRKEHSYEMPRGDLEQTFANFILPVQIPRQLTQMQILIQKVGVVSGTNHLLAGEGPALSNENLQK